MFTVWCIEFLCARARFSRCARTKSCARVTRARHHPSDSSVYYQKKYKDISKYVPEGVEGLVKYKGQVSKIIYNLVGGLKSSMGYLGSKKIKDLQRNGEFVKITKAGFYESMVHNVDHIKQNGTK